MDSQVVNIADKFSAFTELWAPRIIARLNDIHFKLVKLQGEFVWHCHDDTDEAFIVWAGSMSIHFRDGEVQLKEGELYVVPKGVEHKTFAENECLVMVVEPAGTLNTGDTGGHLTAQDGVWL